MDLPMLNIIKWRDESGVNHRLRLLEEMSAKWEEWGKTVGINAAKLKGFKMQYHYNYKDCMGAAVRVWLQMDSKQVCIEYSVRAECIDHNYYGHKNNIRSGVHRNRGRRVTFILAATMRFCRT